MTNDPLGLFDDEANSDPLGLFEGEKESASLGTALKSSFAGVGTTADTALSLLAGGAAGLFGDDTEQERIYREMEKRKEAREQWANPNKEKIGFGGKLLGTVATLPMQIVGSGLSPAETGAEMLNAGETLPKALAGAGIDAVGNAVGMILPGFKQGTMAVRAATGAGANAAQELATKQAISSLSDTQQAKEQFAPNMDDAGIAAIIGGAGAAAGGRRPKSIKADERAVSRAFEQDVTPEADPLGLFTLKPEEAGAGPMRPEPEYTPQNRRQQEFLFDNGQPPVIQVDPAGTGIPGPMSPTDILAQERAGQMQEAALDAQRPLQNQTSMEGPDGQQTLFDQADLMGQGNQFNAGNLGDWRIDENGMPVRADLSIEATNLENPLQRNLWGDELGPALGQERSLTEAIDAIPDTPFRGDQRELALGRLGVPQRGETWVSPVEESSAGARRPGSDEFSNLTRANTASLAQALRSGDAALIKETLDTNLAVLKEKVKEIVDLADRKSAEEFIRAVENKYRSIGEHIKYTEANKAANAALANGPQTLATMVEAIAPHMPPQFMAIMRAIKTVAGDTIVHPRLIEGTVDGPLGQHSRERGIFMNENSPATTALTMLHEGVHSATVAAMAADPHLTAITEMLMDHAADIDPTIRQEYGFVNAKEFIAEAMVNVGLQERLRDMPANDFIGKEIKGRNMWHQFLDLVRQALGLPRNERVMNALDQTMHLGATIMQKQLEIKNTVAEHASNAASIRENNTSMTGSGELWGPGPDTVTTPRSPETLKAKAEKRKFAENFPVRDKRFDEYRDVNTKEEALSQAAEQGFKDNAPSAVGRNLTGGSNQVSAQYNNPLIKFMRTAVNKAHANAKNFSKQYITSKDGLAANWRRLDAQERVNVSRLLMEGDKRQTEITPAMAQKAGVSEAGQKYIKSFYDANKALYDNWSKAREQMGQKAVPYRPGHVPGVFQGSYRTLVNTEKGPVWIATDTKYQQLLAEKYVRENYPNAKFNRLERKGLVGSGRQNDIFSGLNDLKQLLGDVDPVFAELQAAVDEAIKKGNSQLFGFNVHEKAKSGVVGNQGNKPWKDASANAADWHDAMVKYFEEGALHHELQAPLKEVKELIADPDLDMPKTKQYMRDYVANLDGTAALGDVGQTLNRVIDLPLRALGLGSGWSLKTAGAVKNRMSQLMMGWLNYPFTIAQGMQLIQTAFPAMLQAGDVASASAKLMKGQTDFWRVYSERTLGKDLGSTPEQRAMFDYAERSGMLDFSELERAYEGSRGPVRRAVDGVAELNMRMGELATRTPVFMGMTQLLMDNGIPMAEAMPIAKNMTQHAMFDYAQHERPLMYAKMGVLGQFAGGLTTFKHNYVGNMYKYGKDAVLNKANGAGALAGLMLYMITMAGVTGLPGFDELDDLYGQITDKVFGQRKSIREGVMKDTEDWIKYGGLSAWMNLNAFTKFSSADLLPDPEKPMQALSPQLAAASDIAVNAWDVLKSQDKQAVANFLTGIAPNGPLKGMIEDKLMTEVNPQTGETELFNKNRELKYRRTDFDRDIRKWSGMKSLDEVKAQEELFYASKANLADEAVKKDIVAKAKRGFMNNNLSEEKVNTLVDKYLERGGDPKDLFNQLRLQQWARSQMTIEAERYHQNIKGTSGARRLENLNGTE